jgi:hypothetical protein
MEREVMKMVLEKWQCDYKKGIILLNGKLNQTEGCLLQADNFVRVFLPIEKNRYLYLTSIRF